MSSSNQEPLTQSPDLSMDELRLEIERQLTEQARYRSETAASQERTQKEAAEARAALQKEALKAALRDSGVKFHNPEEALILAGEITYDENGKAFDSEGIPLAKSLQELALQKEFLADGRSLRSLKEKRAQETPKSKSDFKNLDQKLKFIEAQGIDAWEKLPTRPPLDLKGNLPRTFSEWKQLPISERSRLLGIYGPGFVGELQKKRQ